MDECKREFATLIKATLHYLQDEWGAHPNVSQSAATEERFVQRSDEKCGVKPEKEKTKETLPPPASNWILNPMPLPAESPPHYPASFKHIPLNVPIRLLVAEQSQLFFLESVARALTKLLAPAALFSGKLDALLTNQNIRLILAPLSHLKKRFPQVELHQFLTFNGPTLLPIADHYDLELKRALWDSLKSFQNMPPSS